MSLFYSAFSKVDEETYKTGLNLHHRTTAFQLKPEPTRSSLERKKEKPVFLSQLSPAAVTEGETARFTVTVAGFPKPSVQWFHNGKGITASSTHTFTHEQDEYSLIINEVERTFEGEYLCTVCNRFGQSNWSSYLHVHLKDLVGYEKEVEKGDDPPNKPPDFSQKIEPLHSPQGGQALFRYKVTGSPLPEVQWLRGSYRIKPSQFCIIVNNSDGSGLMQIQSIKQEDSDIYTCKASNHFGEASCSAELVVFREAVQQEQRTVIQERGYKVTMTEQATESCLYPVSLLGQERSSSDQMVYTIGTEDRQVITSEQVGTIRELNISATTLQREQVTHQAAVLQSHEVEERVSVAPAHPSYISAVPLKQLHMAAFTSSVLESQKFIEQHFYRILSPELLEVEFVKEQPSRLMSAIAQEVVPFTTVKPELLPDNASEQLLTSSEPQQVVCGYQVQSALPIKETSALIVRQEEQKCFRVKEGMKILYTSNCAGQLPINERHVEPLVALESATEPLVDKERPEQVLAPVSETTLILAKENKFKMCRSEEESTIPCKDTVCWSAQCIEETYKIQAEYSGLNQGLESSLSPQSQREKERLLYLQVICDQDILQSEGRFLSEKPLSEQAIAGKNTPLLYPVTQTEQKSLVCETTSGLSVITKSKRVQPKKEVPPTFFLHSVQDVTALPKEGFLSITKPEQQVAAQKQTKTRSHAATYEERREITADNHKDLDVSETGVKSQLGSEPRPLNILQVTSHPMELPKETPFPHDMKQERALVQREERWNLMNVTTLEDIQALVEAHTESLTAENTFTCQTAVEPKVPTEPVQVEKKEISTEISLSIEAAEQDVAVQIQEGQSVRQSIMMVEKHVLKGEFSHEIIKSESSKISVITQPKLYLMAPQTEESTALPKELTFVIQIPKPSSVNIRRQLKDALQSAVAQEQPLLLADVVGKLEAAQIQEVRVQKEPKLAMFTYLVTSSGAAIEISLAFDGEYLQTADLRSELQAAFHSIVYQESQVLTLERPSTILLDSPQKSQAASALSKELLTSVVDSITVSERTRGWHSPVSHSASVKTEDRVTYNSVSVHECAEILELGLGPQQDEGASDLTTTVAKVSVEQHVHRETKEEDLSEAFMISGFSDSIVDYPIVMNPLDHECIEEHSHAVLSTTIKYVTKVNWLFNGKLVKSGKEFTCSKDNDTYTLIINKVIKEHQGEYICEAENEAGKTRTSSRLTVVSRVKPVFRHRPVPLEVNVGSNAKFECDTEDAPNVNFKWFKEGKPIKDGDRCRIISRFNVSSLELISPTKADSGEYCCKASNQHGSDSCSITLNVTEKNKHTLEIPNVELSDQGVYLCRVSNSAGIAMCSTELSVIATPSFVTPLGSVAAVVGAPLHLEAQVDKDTGVTIMWTRDGRKVHQSPDCKLSFERKRVTLDIPKITLKDCGQYVCKATNDAGSTTCSATVRVQEAPSFIKRLESTVAWKQGSSARLQCIVSGSPDLQTSWFLNDRELSPGERYSISLKDSVATLELRSVMLSDSGNYTCEVLNESGCESCTSKVTVKEPPSFMKDLLSVEAVRGSVAMFDCEIEGSAPFEVTWLKNGKRISAGGKYRIVSQGSMSSLEIHYFESSDIGDYKCDVSNAVGVASSKAMAKQKDSEILRDDNANISMRLENNVASLTFSSVEVANAGKYACQVENAAGRQTCEAVLTVQEPARIVEPAESISVTAGDSATLECTIAGSPDLKVQWFKDGKEVTSGRKYKITLKEKTAMLKILAAEKEESSEFRMEVSNKVGKDQCKSSVTVLEPPAFTVKPDNREVKEGSTISLKSAFTGTVPLAVKWFREEKEISTGGSYLIKKDALSSTLELHSVKPSDSAKFTCQVSNDAGKVDCTAVLVVKEPPTFSLKLVPSRLVKSGQPLTLSCKVEDSPGLSVKWFRNGCEIISNYRQLCEAGDAGKYQYTVTNEVGEISSSCHISLKEPPSFVQRLEDLTYQVGSEVSLKCMLTGSLPMEVSWVKDNCELKEDEHIKMSYEAKTAVLNFKNTQKTHSGKYVCHVHNEAGSQKCVAVLTVTEPPKFLVKLPPSTFVKQSESHRFECKTNSATSIKLCWYKNDQKLTVGDNYNIGFADSTAYLKLRTTSVEDNGVYTCEAYNDAGNASCSTVLAVQGQTLNRLIM
ncbi:unnamed protein product [Arctogadus glacialis]